MFLGSGAPRPGSTTWEILQRRGATLVGGFSNLGVTASASQLYSVKDTCLKLCSPSVGPCKVATVEPSCPWADRIATRAAVACVFFYREAWIGMRACACPAQRVLLRSLLN